MGASRNGKGDAAVVRLAAGNQPLPGPPFADARVTGDILRIRIRGDLDTGSTPLGSAFKVTASQYGSDRTINGSDVPKHGLDPVRISYAGFASFKFTYVYVMLTESVRRGETVTVSYTRPSQNPLRDQSGNRHTYSFSSQPVANHTRRDTSDTTPPTLASAEVKKPNDQFAVMETTLLLTFTENLEIPSAGTAGSAFSVTVTNPNTNAERTISGKGTVSTGERNNLGFLVPNKVANVTLDGRVLRRETVTVSYTQPAKNPLQDENGNAVATFTGQTVTNNIPLPMATRVQVMPNDQSYYTRLLVTFDQELDNNNSPANAFSMTSIYKQIVSNNGVLVERERTHTHTGTGTAKVLTGDLSPKIPGVIPGRTLEVTLDTPMLSIAEFTVTYTKPSSGSKLRDAVHNEVPNFTLAEGSRATFVVCSATLGYYALTGDLAGYPGASYVIPCDMARPAWKFGGNVNNPIVWFYGESNPAPPMNQPVESVVYTIPGRPNHRAVRDAEGHCYREERVNGQWQRSTSYGSDEESCRRASWNTYYRAMASPAIVNPDGGTFPSGPAPVVAMLDSAAVNEETLTLTFDRSLDGSSLPAPSAFAVTANGARSSVSSGGVAISGETVTLTLNSSVALGATVRVGYTRPTENPLRTANGIDVETFTDRTVTNNTEGTFWSATLTVSQGTLRTVSDEVWTGCWTEGRATSCSSALTEDSFTFSGVSYQVTGIYRDGQKLEMATNSQLPAGTTWHIDNQQFRVANATTSTGNPGQTVHRWQESDTWTAGQRVSLRLTAPTPTLNSAVVDGETLTMTFSGNLDSTSVPAPGDFYVTVNSARRNVATGGVAISGQTVTLTLASAAAYGDTVKVRYTKPSANPLQSDGQGVPVETFTDQTVTNDTTAIWSATLTAGPAEQSGNGCRIGSTTLCSTALTDDDFIVGGTTYQVEILAAGISADSQGFVDLQLDREIPTTWTLTVGSNPGLTVSTAFRSNQNKRARWHPVNWGIGSGDTFSVGLTAPPGSASGDAGSASGLSAPDEEQVPDVSVTGVSVVSDPGADQTYGIGDTIQVQVTFNRLVVDVDTSGGTPRLKIDMDPAEWGEKWAILPERQRHRQPDLLPHRG